MLLNVVTCVCVQFPGPDRTLSALGCYTEGEGGSGQREPGGKREGEEEEDGGILVMKKTKQFVLPPVQQDLCTFLISRACKNSTLANYLYW